MSRPFVYSAMYFVGTVRAIGRPMYWKLFSATKITGIFWFVALRTALK